MDPWTIAPDERARHQQQFQSVGPGPNGMVTGAQARGFFMQSGLPPMVLAQIWGLADMNGDGQMDMTEFSVACKLITNQLKGFPLPKQLPPSLLMNPMAPPQPAPAPGMPMAPMMQQQQPMMMQPQQMGGAVPPPVASVAPPGMQMMGQPMPQMTNMAAAAPTPMMGGMAGVPVSAAAPPMMPPAGAAGSPVPPTQLAPAAAAAPPMDWAVPMMTRQKYQAQFVNTDRNRTGFLAGVQARNLLLQTGLPQNVLAQIWGLSDVDNDGRLSTEEFVLAGHFCDLAMKGEPLPPAGVPLPPALVPPSMRPPAAVAVAVPGAAPTSGAPSTAPGTPASGGGGKPGGEEVGSPSTFEDKRRENFNKGQAELERRRQSLIDQQKKEEEDRKRKEKEEAEAREKQKQEMERQRLAEWEKQRKAELIQHRQREQEKVLELKAKQEHLNSKLESMREKVSQLTSDIGETRTGVTDVKTFIDGMRTSRDTKMKEMADLKAKLKDQNARLLAVTQEKAKMEAKNKARQGQVDAGNDAELTEFEIKKAEKEKHVVELREKFSALKEKEDQVREKFESEKVGLEEHKEKLRSIIEACKALYDNFDDKRREVKAEKAKRIRELTDPDHAWNVDDIEEPAAAAVTAAHSSSQQPALVRGTQSAEYVEYRAVYDFESTNADELPFKVGDIISVRTGQDHEPGWLGGELDGKLGWFPEAYVERVDSVTSAALHTIAEEPVTSSTTAAAAAEVTSSETRARALFDFKATEATELSIERGEMVTVTSREDAIWWYGIGDNSMMRGYFPASHVSTEALEVRGSTPTEAPEAPAAPSPKQQPTAAAAAASAPAAAAATVALNEGEEACVALYTYASEEPGDLTFEAGETMVVIKKDGNWWTGKIGDRTGVFPYNYVEAVATSQAATVETPVAAAAVDSEPTANEQVEKSEGESEPPPPKEASADSTKNSGKEGEEDKAVSSAPADESVGVTGEAPPPDTKEEVAADDEAAADPAVVVANAQLPPVTTTSESESEGGSKSKKPEIATVVAAYTATSKEQLSLQRGQMILVRKKNSTGWWQGELQGGKGKKRQLGWFPATYVKLMEGGGAGEKTAAAAAAADSTAVAAAADATNGGGGGDGGGDTKAKFRALYPYGGQHDDELSFEAGDVISLLSKDEEAWWKGELNGKSGVFPSNYVEEISS